MNNSKDYDQFTGISTGGIELTEEMLKGTWVLNAGEQDVSSKPIENFKEYLEKSCQTSNSISKD
ncbi:MULTISPECIES: hypothetical protein [unclassified Acinetobacter]|uniref:hypothetical protein n=1 Tax=unclassified Acinetobacter TaxID=196816 RepID=UPI0004D70393|nr:MULTISPECIES: hypothetical protein [unclassified Acinetobacter]KEC83295.1 hypothetical protein DT74_16825 [Acinetobacter sp. ETR1]WEE38339.1 hypothetical protein PYV58_15500 [Acinetobacter sp. TAC-1]